MNTWMLLGYSGLLVITAFMLKNQVMSFLSNHGVLADNYQEKRIPSASGILIWLTGGAALLLLSLWSSWAGDVTIQIITARYDSFFLAWTIVFCLGWTDDLIGDRSIKGLRGHIRSFYRYGQLTTGLVKAIGTFVASLWLSLNVGLWQSALTGVCALLVMMLSTNAMNLFDLRPGRALKVYMVGWLIVIVAATEPTDALIMGMPMVAGALILLPADLKGQSMLGDTGANLLGFSLGGMAAYYWDWQLLAAAISVLLGLQWFAEKYSLTRLIERVPLLNWLDRIGRE